jgi:hypothetical protein
LRKIVTGGAGYRLAEVNWHLSRRRFLPITWGMDSRPISWRPLGQLFVEKGLLTEDRLERALAVQEMTGGRLGDKLVELGFVTRHALARLLAEQYDGEFTVDTGFGTGLLVELERRSGGVPEDAVVATAPAPSDPDPHQLGLIPGLYDVVKTPLAALEEVWARLAAAEARIADLELQLGQARRPATA